MNPILAISALVCSLFCLLFIQKYFITKNKIATINKRSSQNTIATNSGGISIFITLFAISSVLYISGIDLFDYKIFCRAVEKFTPFRWYGNNVTQGYESMDINNRIFWTWIDDYKPDIILFQDQNTYSQSKMIDETNKLQRMGIKLINYADWIYRNDLKNYRGLYNVNLAHIKRNYQWFKENKPKIADFWKEVLRRREIGGKDLLPKKRKIVKIELDINLFKNCLIVDSDSDSDSDS